MVTTNRYILPNSDKYCYCVYASRCCCRPYVMYSYEEIMERYGRDMIMCERMIEIRVLQTGKQMYTVKLPNQTVIDDFSVFVQ